MGTVWDSDDRPEDYDRYNVEHPPSIVEIITYGVIFAAVIAIVIALLFFTGP